MQPTQQGLRADDAGSGIDLGLVIELKLTALQGPAQIGHERVAFIQGRLHRRVEETQAVAALVPSPVERQAGLLQEAIDRSLAAAKQRDAEMGRTMVFQPIQVIGLGQHLAHLLGHLPGLGRSLRSFQAEVFQEQHELVAAHAGNGFVQARDGVALAHHALQTLRHLDQEGIAQGQATAVVEGLEAVQIEIQEQHCAVASAARAAGQRLGESVEQQAAVGQVRERIAIGQVVDRRLGVGIDPGEIADIVADHARLAPDGGQDQPLRMDLAILVTVPGLALPIALFPQGLPHLLMKHRVVPPREQQVQAPTDDLRGRIAGQTGEGLVDAEDDPARVRDQHAFLRLEGDGGDAHFLLGADRPLPL